MRGDLGQLVNEELLVRSVRLAARMNTFMAVTFLFVIAVGAMYLSL
jgi:hypothetical protein